MSNNEIELFYEDVEEDIEDEIFCGYLDESCNYRELINCGLHKEKKEYKTMWVDNVDTVGEHLFTFDKKKIYNLFSDYPYNMTEAEVDIFNEENPYWAEFFSWRFENKSREQLGIMITQYMCLVI